MTEQIISDNELIANFMDVKFEDDGYCYDSRLQFIRGRDYAEWASTCKIKLSGINNGKEYTVEVLGYKLDKTNLEYHVSYDWLMPVIDKIMLQPKHPMLVKTQLTITKHILLPNSIHSVWEIVVDYIKWYNEENKL